MLTQNIGTLEGYCKDMFNKNIPFALHPPRMSHSKSARKKFLWKSLDKKGSKATSLTQLSKNNII